MRMVFAESGLTFHRFPNTYTHTTAAHQRSDMNAANINENEIIVAKIISFYKLIYDQISWDSRIGKIPKVEKN